MPDYPTLIPKTSTPTPETLPGGGTQLPALFSPDSATAQRVLEFFTANIRNPHTRKAYATAVRGFAAWTDTIGIAHLRYIAATPCRRLYRAVAEPPVGSFGQTPAGRDPHALRLACGGPDCPHQPGQRRARAEAFAQEGQDARADS